MASRADAMPIGSTAEYGIWRVILASSVGTMIEWYDFYIFGSLAAVLSVKFYPPGNDTFAYIAYLATFAVGFLVRPFGALFFGRIGDLVGRKYAFLVTLTIMGGATFLIGLMPTYSAAGWFAPIVLILFRVLQGLALGGEYGGAAVYVAEHAPDGKRGFYTSFIQITATLGLFVSLIVILATQYSMSKEAFSAWGWRIPFLISIILVTISLYIRLKMKESPIFSSIKTAGTTSIQPLKDSFGKWENLKRVLISLFGATAGQGVVWYTGQFYALFYMQTILKVNARTANYIIAIALLLGMPLFTVFGTLSDRIGRKGIMMAGCVIAVLTYGSAESEHPHAGASGAHPSGLRLHGVRAHRGLSRRGLPRQDTLHITVRTLSHRQRRLWRTVAADRIVVVRCHWQYLCRTVLSNDRGGHDLCRRQLAFEGDARHQDLGRSRSMK